MPVESSDGPYPFSRNLPKLIDDGREVVPVVVQPGGRRQRIDRRSAARRAVETVECRRMMDLDTQRKLAGRRARKAERT